jgi:multidrug resistance efflux pump
VNIDTSLTQNNDDSVISVESFSGRSHITLDQLNQSAKDADWYEVWLEYCLQETSGITDALLTADDSSSRLKPVAASIQDPELTNLLGDLIDEAAHSQSPIVIPQDEHGVYGVAYPIKLGVEIKAVFSCRVILTKAEEIETFMSRLEWLCLWVELFYQSSAGQQQAALVKRQNITLDGYLSVTKADEWHESALQWADNLAKVFSCERVSFGFVKHQQIKLAVISGSTDNDLRSVSAKKMRAAMQESFDQRSIIRWPLIDDKNIICHNTEKLSFSHHNSQILIIPLVKDDDIYAMALFERTAEQPFIEHDINFIEATTSLVGLALNEKKQAQVSLFTHIAKQSRKQLERMLAPGYLKRKIFLIVSVFALVFFSVVEGGYTVNADVTLEPRQIRIVSAPYNGFIKSVEVSAGDQVQQGSELLAMEDRDLRLERIKWLSQIEQDNKEYNESMAAYDRSKAQILYAKMAQSRAQLAVTTSQLERSILKAPFDSLVVAGDLSKRVGGSVNQGEELYQISPLNDYRLILFVSEYKILDVELEQQGHVLFSSLSSQEFKFTIEKITPITEVKDKSTFYRVEAGFDSNEVAFRPGMVGVGKVFVDRRLLIDIWTHDLRKWLALKLWSFWG